MWRLLLPLTFFYWFFSWPSSATEVIRIYGKVVPKLSEDQCLVESGGAIFDLKCDYIKKHAINLKPFESIELLVDRKAINKVWSIYPTKLSTPLGVEPALAAEDTKGGMVHIRGRQVWSFEEPFVLVEVDKVVYKIRRSSLTEETKNQVSKNGQIVNLAVPRAAIEMAWSFHSDTKNSLSREVALSKPEEGVQPQNGNLKLTGQVVFSFEDAYTIIEANDTYYKVERSRIRQPAALAVGSHIEVEAPPQAIVLVWSSQPTHEGDLQAAILPL